MIELFLKGLLIGILASAPLGPAGIICIRRTLQRGLWAGLSSGIGIMTADVIFGSIASLGMAKIRDVIVSHENLIMAVLAFILLIVGTKIWRENIIHKLRKTPKMKQSTYWNYSLSMFILTINPINILPLFFLCALFNATMELNSPSTYTLILGIAIGAFLWWLMISLLFSHFRRKFRVRHLWWANRISGIVIVSISAFLFCLALWRTIQVLNL